MAIAVDNVNNPSLLINSFPLDFKNSIGGGGAYNTMDDLLSGSNAYRQYQYNGNLVIDIGTGRLARVKTDNINYGWDYADNHKIWFGTRIGDDVGEVPDPDPTRFSGNFVYQGDVAITSASEGDFHIYMCIPDPSNPSVSIWEDKFNSEDFIVETPHNNLKSKQGGGVDEYYHLSFAEYTIATQEAASAVSGYVTFDDQEFGGVKTFIDGLIIGDSSSVPRTDYAMPIGRGDAGQVLTTNGNGTISWQTPSATGITSLNGSTFSEQSIIIGTGGNDINITLIDDSKHQINIPDASGTARGVVTIGQQTFAGNKIFNGTVRIGDAFTTLGNNFMGYQTSGTTTYVYNDLKVGKATTGGIGDPSTDFTMTFGVDGATGDTTIGSESTPAKLTVNGQAYSPQVSIGPVTSDYPIDLNKSNVFYIEIGGNITLSATNMVAGSTYIIAMKTSGSTQTVRFNSTIFDGIGDAVFEPGTMYTWSGICINDGTNTKLYGVVDEASKNLLA